jgi:hypothetical protein
MSDKKVKNNNANLTYQEKLDYYDKRITNLRIQIERFIGGVEVLEKLKQEEIEKEKNKK